MDPETIAFYDARPGDYADMVERESPDGSPQLAAFAASMPAGGRVLDFGCGPGWAAAWLAARGFEVDATDGSAGLAAEGRRRYGVEIRIEGFADLAAERIYDGVWCSFALLHDSRTAFPGHLSRLARALKPGGLLYLGMKAGEGEKRDSLGRRYFYLGEADLAAALRDAGFGTPKIEAEELVGCAGTPETCLHATARLGETGA